MKYGLEERFVKFSAVVMDFAEGIPRSFSNDYLAKQIIRSAGSATLNFGEVLGAGTQKDYINKCNIVFKELKETELNLRIMVLRGINSQDTEEILEETHSPLKDYENYYFQKEKRINPLDLNLDLNLNL
jgi:four helix bundle protein